MVEGWVRLALMDASSSERLQRRDTPGSNARLLMSCACSYVWRRGGGVDRTRLLPNGDTPAEMQSECGKVRERDESEGE